MSTRFQFVFCSQSNHILSIRMSKSGALVAWCGKTVSVGKMVGLIGLEPMTPALSRRCSNQLSYRPGGLFAARFHKRPEWWRLTDSNR